MADKAVFAQRKPDWEPRKLHEGLQLSSFDPLQTCQRSPCPKCHKSCARYCAVCRIPLTDVPHVSLPLRVAIVTHEHESKAKNSGVHAKILAPEDVEMVPLDAVDVHALDKCAVLFPSEHAVEPADLDISKIDKVYVIDSKWMKAMEIMRSHPEFSKMQRVKLCGNIRTSFWRFHTEGVGDDGLCTVEALYFFFKQLQENPDLASEFRVEHAFDNLLWYFAHQHGVVWNAWRNRQKKRCVKSNIDGQASDREESLAKKQRIDKQNGTCDTNVSAASCE